MTPHIEAAPGDYAEDILLPGDPARAEWIAETFLENVKIVNRVRGATGLQGCIKADGFPFRPQVWACRLLRSTSTNC